MTPNTVPEPCCGLKPTIHGPPLVPSWKSLQVKLQLTRLELEAARRAFDRRVFTVVVTDHFDPVRVADVDAQVQPAGHELNRPMRAGRRGDGEEREIEILVVRALPARGDRDGLHRPRAVGLLAVVVLRDVLDIGGVTAAVDTVRRGEHEVRGGAVDHVSRCRKCCWVPVVKNSVPTVGTPSKWVGEGMPGGGVGAAFVASACIGVAAAIRAGVQNARDARCAAPLTACTWPSCGAGLVVAAAAAPVVAAAPAAAMASVDAVAIVQRHVLLPGMRTAAP